MITWQARYAIVLIVLLAAVLDGVLGGDWHPWIIGSYGVAGMVLWGALEWWDRFLWRQRWVQQWLPVPRDVSGVWKGTLASHWKDPKTGKRLPEKDVYLVVRQRSSRVSATLMTNESTSHSTVAAVAPEEEDIRLGYLYSNEPDLKYQSRSRRHRGAASLRVSGDPEAQTLSGSYWTDRETVGELAFRDRRRKFPTKFEEAEGLFYR